MKKNGKEDKVNEEIEVNVETVNKGTRNKQ